MTLINSINYSLPLQKKQKHEQLHQADTPKYFGRHFR